jgi:ribosomal protein L28
LHNGFNIGNKGVKISLSKRDKKIVFDPMATNKGLVMDVDMLPLTSQETITVPMLKQGKQININVCTRCLDTPEKRR